MRSLIRSTALATALFATPAFAALDHYEFDKQHTHICFYISHMGFSEMMGIFTSYDGSFQFDPAAPEKSVIDVTLHPSGIRTSSEMLDHHLQGEKWFNTAKYPDIHFVSQSVKTTGEHTGDVTGNVTMLGVTKPVVLHVHFNKADYQPITNLFVAGFNADATLTRSDFGMKEGIPLVGDEVRIEISTEGVDQDLKKAGEIKH